MGATTFYTEAEGRTVNEAFDNASRDAAHEYGHGGYTGTIAEKAGAVVFQLPQGMTPDALFGMLSNISFDLLREEQTPVCNTVTYTRVVTMKVTETTTCRVPIDDKPPAEPFVPHMSSYDTRNATVTRALKWKRTKIDPPQKYEIDSHRQLAEAKNIPGFRRMCEVFDDKWGAAVAVPAGPNRWAFMGYASC